jgi:two-component system sensor histidine kinase CiaH
MSRVLSLRRSRSRASAQPDAEALRRTRRRLVILTVSLLSALLLALGSIVYIASRQMLMQSLHDQLRSRASAAMPGLLRGFDHPAPPQSQNGNGVFLSLADTSLNLVAHDGPAAQSLPDTGAAQQLLQLPGGPVFSQAQVDGNGPYLVYTVLVVRDLDNSALGVVQAYMSEHQYQQDLQLLLEVLGAVSAVGLLASSAISYWLANRALYPVQRAMQRQRDFVADAAHELRTPLAIMRTAAELSLDGGSENDQQAALEQTLAQNAHLAGLVDSLSLLARADSGVVALERHPLDLARLTRETAGGIAILAEEREVRLQVQAAQETLVLADSGRLRQLLLIVLDNALKHTPDGGAIGVLVERSGNKVHLVVRDSGPGIAAADLPYLFDRFYRADRSRSTEGSGLGLSIGRWIVGAHGGKIVAANGPEGGAVFTVTLPAA